MVLIGSESTGKTTLAADLAAAFGTVWVPEYGREHWEGKLARGEPHFWRANEFADIARGQCERENAAARRANRVLVCDTDAFATRVWHHRYLDSWSPEVDAIVAVHRRPDLYLLTDIATPFVQDGTRDGELVRERMHRMFVEEFAGRRPGVPGSEGVAGGAPRRGVGGGAAAGGGQAQNGGVTPTSSLEFNLQVVPRTLGESGRVRETRQPSAPGVGSRGLAPTKTT